VYAWLVTVFFGVTLLDIAYSNLLKNGLNIAKGSVATSEISDFLLCFIGAAVLSAFPAIFFAWKSIVARYCLIASLCLIAVEIFAPIFLRPFIQALPSINLGAMFRLLLGGCASVLAFGGLLFYDWHNVNCGDT
jgi:hypothetical protein